MKKEREIGWLVIWPLASLVTFTSETVNLGSSRLLQVNVREVATV